jgi:integrase
MKMSGKRAQGEGSVYHTRDGRWRVAISSAGSRQYLSARTKQKALAKLRAAQKQLDGGLTVGDERVRTGKFLERWLDEIQPRVRPRTLVRYQQLVKIHLLPELGHIPLISLTPDMVQALLRKKLGEGLAPRTVHHLRAVLRTALNRALRWGLVLRNVAALTDPPRVERHELAILTIEQVRQLAAACEDDDIGPLVMAALTTGMRSGELLALRWEDVDLESASLRVSHSLQRMGGNLILVETKTRRSRRTVPLPSVAVEALKVQRRRQLEAKLLAGPRWLEGGFVFTSSLGTPLDASNVLHRFQRLLAAADLPRMRFHDLRHSAASLLLALGVPARVVMEVLGHSQISITLDTYTHVAAEVRQEAALAMDRLFAPAVGT